MMVSEVGFGTSPIGGMIWGNVDEADSLAALRRAFDLGVNFFDTADVYGHGRSEELVAEALAEVRPNVVIATKGGLDFSRPGRARPNFDPAYIRDALDASLSRLRTDYVDLYLLHNPPQKLAKDEPVWDLLADLKAAGKIRFFGVSARTANDARFYLRTAHGENDEHSRRFGDAVQVAYNLLDQKAATKGVFVEAARQDWGVVSRVPLASGLLSGKYDAGHYFPPNDFRGDWSPERFAETLGRVEALRFLARNDRTLVQTAIAFALSQEATSTVIAGARNAAQVEENVTASGFAPLPDEDLRAAQDLFERDFP
jgi:aryl-alcohol dehydrogenase-like predicted oxidoreductase